MKAEAIVQNCYVVRDLEAACARMHAMYGIGPFLGGAEAVLDNHRYRGAPADPIRLRGVFVQSGDLNIELVELLSDGPDAFRDMYPGKAEGFHHVAIFCDDYEATGDRIVAQGCPVASAFTVAWGSEICYLDARDTLGHMIELYPEDPVIRARYAEARDAALNWDQRELIIPWAL